MKPFWEDEYLNKENQHLKIIKEVKELVLYLKERDT